jgi:hypothetical protein
MKIALTRINELIAGANPDTYDSVSYNKYFRDLTDISNKIMLDDEKQAEKNAELMKAINELKTGVGITNEHKTKLLEILLK